MAWTAPRTYTTGEVVTASILNTDHRDNISWLKDIVEGDATELLSPKSWGDRPVAVPPKWAPAAGAILYTCPANTYAIVTEVRLTSNYASAVWARVAMRGYDFHRRDTTLPVPAYNTISIPCWVWLQPGETIAISAQVDYAIFGSATVWEVPSSLTGITLKRNQLTSVAADTWTTLIGPDAGKTLVVKHVCIRADDSPLTTVILSAEEYYQHATSGPVAPYETVHFNNEIIVVSTGNLIVCCTGGAAGHVMAHGWQV